jgi:hypothetical protein
MDIYPHIDNDHPDSPYYKEHDIDEENELDADLAEWAYDEQRQER